MSQRVKKNVESLLYLSKAKPNIVKTIIQHADRDLLNALFECALNVLKGHVTLTKYQKTKLKPYCKHLRCLVDKKQTIKKKRSVLQTGGFLPALLGPLASVLVPLIGKVLS